MLPKELPLVKHNMDIDAGYPQWESDHIYYDRAVERIKELKQLLESKYALGYKRGRSIAIKERDKQWHFLVGTENQFLADEFLREMQEVKE